MNLRGELILGRKAVADRGGHVTALREREAEFVVAIAMAGAALISPVATHIDTLLPIDRMTPGSFGKKECNLEEWGTPYDLSNAGNLRSRWTCT